MDTKQRTRTAFSPLLQSVRQCYHSFLLHLMLGFSVTGLLLLCVIALDAYLPTAAPDLNAAVFSSLIRPNTEKNIQSAISLAVFEQTTYSLPGIADAYFPIPQTTSTVENTSFSRPAGELLQNIDGSVPLSHPLLDNKAVSGQIGHHQSDEADSLPADHTAIRAIDLSQSNRFNGENSGILFSNQTAYSVDALSHLSAAYPIASPALPTMTVPMESPDAAAPLVLILHTHGTEAYAPDGVESVPAGYSYRSEDITENVVSVGAILADALQTSGITVLHCKTMFDAESYTDSYDQAAAYIRDTLAANPSILYVFDVHRDALQASDGSMLRPITKIGAETCAQVMSVVGTDAAGAYYPDWHDRLTVAVHLQQRLNEVCQTFARPINLRSATFNAQYAPGSLLLEIGAAGNSVEEARSAAYHLGKILAELILQS